MTRRKSELPIERKVLKMKILDAVFLDAVYG